MIGKTISHYRILEKIGQGGMGVIYLAEDTRLRRTVALKFLPPHLLGSDAEKARFIHEARAAAALDHPNICTIHEIDEADGTTFIAMTYVEGESLKKKIEARPLALPDAVRYAIQIGNGLKEAHNNDVVHRDVKSANVVISAKNHAVVMDFGLAKLRGQTRLTREGTTVGTVAYMSPEQARGEDVDRRSDIWSLGVVLYEMLTGRLPFRGEHEAAVVYAIMNENSEPVTALRSDIPMDLERIVNKATAKNPQERYQSVDDMLVDLKAVQKGLRPAAAAQSHTHSKRRSVFGYAAVAVAVAAVAFALYLWIGNRRDDSGLPGRTAVAVLPLDNLSNDPEQEYFADGMTEALITQLAQISALKVISRTSVMQYKNTARSLKEIAHELGVGTIVEGSVLLADDRVRITAQLIDAATDEHLWATSYDRDMTDVLAIHSEVARAVAEAVRAELTSQEAIRLERKQTVDPAAYELYLRGRYFWNRRNQADIERSIDYFQRAIEIDPGYAEAYAATAAAYMVLTTHGSIRSRETYPLAREYARKALDLDPGLAAAHAALGGIAAEYDWQWDEAEARYKRAIALNPNDATAHQWYAEYLHMMGRWDEALAEIRIAQSLDPLSLIIGTVRTTIVYNTMGLEEARPIINDILERDPTFQFAWAMLSTACISDGLYDEGVESFLTYLELFGVRQENIDTLRVAYNRHGFEAFCQAQIDMLRIRSRTDYVPPQLFATAFSYLNEPDSMFHYMEFCYRERSLSLIKAWPPYYRYRSDPRYTALLRRMNLPE
jgi:eukaryotic-like serine/threonine-protein kinase